MSEVRTETFPAGGQIQLLGGRFFMLLETSGPVTVRFERGGTTFGGTNVEAGYAIPLLPESLRFDRVRITGTPATTVTYILGEEEADYRRVVGVFELQGSSSLQAPTNDVAVGAAATQLVAAGSRKKVTVKVVSGDTAVRVGPQATIAAARGLQLNLGESYTYEGEGAVHGIREGGTAASVCVLEEI